MGWCSKSDTKTSEKTETPVTPCADCEKAKKGGVVWEKQPGATDEDLAKAQQQWEDAKKRRLPDGSKPKTVEAMEALEKSDKTTTIKVGDDGNEAIADSWDDAKDPTKGSNATINFDPDKKGELEPGVDRDPESSLAHESFHAYEITQGALSPEDNWVEQAEVGATGAENEHRAAKASDGEDTKQRTKYGDWDVPQYEAP